MPRVVPHVETPQESKRLSQKAKQVVENIEDKDEASQTPAAVVCGGVALAANFLAVSLLATLKPISLCWCLMPFNVTTAR